MVTQEVQPVSATSAITTSFGYDAAGNNTRYTDGNGNQWWDTYNSWGLQEKRIEPYTTGYTTAATSTFTTAYDADAAGTTSYTYDNDDRLATLANPATGTTGTYSYNSDSLLTGISYGSGKDTQSFGYDTQHRLTSDTLKSSSGTTVASVGYGYNADSEVTSENTVNLAGAASNTYTYDEAAGWRRGTTARRRPRTGTTRTGT